MIAVLNDTPTARAMLAALPVNGNANTWGDEVYFSIPGDMQEDNAWEVADKGEIAYCPPDRAFRIFFCPTPVRRGGEIGAASLVTGSL